MSLLTVSLLPLVASCAVSDLLFPSKVVLLLLIHLPTGINSNYGDSCTLTDYTADDVDDVCVTYTGTDDNDEEPEENDDNGGGCDGTYCIC